MPLLLAPFPQHDPLALAQLTRAGINDFRSNMDRSAALQQNQADTALKFQSQMLGDIQDSLWKGRELARREQADHFNMQLELQKLRMHEEDLTYRREHALDRYNPLLNPEAAARIASNEALTNQRISKTLTPEQQAEKAEQDKVEFQTKQVELAAKRRELDYAQASGVNAQATDVLTSMDNTDATNMPMTEEASKAFRMAESLKEESAASMKLNAPVAKPGVIPAPKPPKAPSYYEQQRRADDALADQKQRVMGMEQQVDESKKAYEAARKRLDAFTKDVMKTKMAETDPAMKKELEGLKADVEAARTATIRDIDGRPAKVDVSKAEEWLGRSREELAKRRSQLIREMGTNGNWQNAPEDGRAGAQPLPTNQAPPISQTGSPLLPSIEALPLDGGAKDVLKKMLTPSA